MQSAERIDQILKTIVCPACRGYLVAEPGFVRCAACCRRYPVEDGIPVLLIERATLEP